MGPADAMSRRPDHADEEMKGAFLKGKPIKPPDDMESIPLSMHDGERVSKANIPLVVDPNSAILACIDIKHGASEEYLGASTFLYSNNPVMVCAVTRNRGRES